MAANLFSQYLTPPKSVADYLGEMDAADARREGLAAQRQANAIQALTMDQQRRTFEETQADKAAYASAVRGWQPNTPVQQRAESLYATGRPGLVKMAQDLLTQDQTWRENEGKIGKTGAEAAGLKIKNQAAGRQELMQTVVGLADPAAASELITGAVSRGELPMQVGQLLLKSVPTSGKPDDFRVWQLRLAASVADPAKMVELLRPKVETINAGGFTSIQAIDPMTGLPRQTGSVRHTQSPDSAASVAATIRGQNMADARAREKIASDEKIAGKVDWKQDVDGNWVALPKEVPLNGGPITPVKTTEPGKKEVGARRVLELLDDAEKLVPTATGSYSGALVDEAGRVVGASTAGATATAKLRTIEGALMMGMPRMEGPQSDKDVQMYRQSAGALGDPTVPRAQKLEAIKTIREIQSRYAGLGGAPVRTAGAGGAATPPRGGASAPRGNQQASAGRTAGGATVSGW